MTEPALAHWLDEHRNHLTERIFHLMWLLQTLHDRDEHTLHTVLAEHTAIAAAAAQVYEYLQHTELTGTRLAQEYRRLAHDSADWWREVFQQRGADALREATVERLERTARELTNPPEPQPSQDRLEDDTREFLYAPAAERLLAVLHQLREELAALRHDPHDPHHPHHRAAADSLLAEANEQTGSLVHRLEQLCDAPRHAAPSHQSLRYGDRPPPWATMSLEPLQAAAHGLATATLDHPDPLDTAALSAITGLNILLGR